jgi:mono/diheme cytochrome c family protein
MRAVVAGAAIAACLLAGCGSRAGGSARIAQGRQIFASQCSGCHTLAGREHGASGGDLVLAHLHEKDLASFARVMPTKQPLSAEQARAVASYVVSVVSAAGASGPIPDSSTYERPSR